MKRKDNILKLFDVFKRFSSFEGSLFRYSLSYSFLLALFPTLIIVVMLFHSSLLDSNILFDNLYRFLPEDLLEPFVNFLMKKSYNDFVSIIISMITGFYFASKSLYSFMLISAKYENFNVPKFLIRIKSYVLFAVMVISVTVISLFVSTFHYSAIIVLGAGLFFVLMLLYRTLVFEKKPLTYGLSGSIFSTIAIILFALLFFRIMEYFTDYGSLYGPMASLLVLMLSIYIFSSIIFFGYCINVVYGASFPNKKFKNEWYYKNGQKIMHKVKSTIKKIL